MVVEGMRVNGRKYGELYDLVRYTGRDPSAGRGWVHEDAAGSPLTVDAAILATALKYADRSEYRARPGKGDTELLWRPQDSEGNEAPGWLVKAVLHELWHSLVDQAVRQAAVSLGVQGLPKIAGEAVTLCAPTADVVLCPGVEYDPHAARPSGKLRATAHSARMALLWTARWSQGVGDLPFAGGMRPDHYSSISIPTEVGGLLKLLAERYKLTYGRMLRACYSAYAQAVRTGRQPKPRHYDATLDTAFALNAEERTLTAEAWREPKPAGVRERRILSKDELGAQGLLPRRQQREWDGEQAYKYALTGDPRYARTRP